MAQNSYFVLSQPNRGIRINNFPTLENQPPQYNNQYTYLPATNNYNNIPFINNNQIHSYGTSTFNNPNYTNLLANNYLLNNNIVNLGNIGIPSNDFAKVIPLNNATNIVINNQDNKPQTIYTLPNKSNITINNPYNTLINPGLNTLNQTNANRPSARPLSHNTLNTPLTPISTPQNIFINSNTNKKNNEPINTNINVNKVQNPPNILNNNITNQKQIIQNNNINNTNNNKNQINQKQINPLTNVKNNTMINQIKEIPNQNNNNTQIKNPAIVRKVSKTVLTQGNPNQNNNDIDKDIVKVKKIPNNKTIDNDLVTVQKITEVKQNKDNTIQNKIDINKSQEKMNNISNKEIHNQNINNKIPQAQATVKKIGEERIKQEIPNQNSNNKLQQDQATVKKISNEKVLNPAPTPAPTPIPLKLGPISKADLYNIIYFNVGMMNLGNTCFINSCLQVLIHCPIFIRKFFDQRNLINKNDTLISAYFYDVCLVMVNCKNTQEHYIDNTNFKSVFGSKHHDFE